MPLCHGNLGASYLEGGALVVSITTYMLARIANLNRAQPYVGIEHTKKLLDENTLPYLEMTGNRLPSHVTTATV